MNNKSIYLIYDATNCTPNGDPDNGEQRYNEITKRAIVSDLRVKRFGRDKLNELGTQIYYFYDKEKIVSGKDVISGAAARFKHFCEENNIQLPVKKSKSKKNVEEPEEEESGINVNSILLQNFVDVRVFGGVLTSKETKANIMGALQFDPENNSVNEVIHGKNFINRGITTVFPSKDINEQGSIGRDSYLRYGLFSIKGRFSASTAKKNNTTDVDLNLALTAIWEGIKSINTRSKFGHEPIAFIIVDHPTRAINNGFIGKIFPKRFSPFTIQTEKHLSDLFSRNDYEFDFTPLKNKLLTDEVESVTIYCEDENFIQKHFTGLADNCKIVNPFDEFLNLL